MKFCLREIFQTVENRLYAGLAPTPYSMLYEARAKATLLLLDAHIHSRSVIKLELSPTIALLFY
jgi:hypothetical protein